MKLQFFQTLFCLALATLTFSNPIKTEVESIEEVSNNNSTNIITLSNPFTKRADIGTYISSIGNFFKTKDVKRNVFYDGIKNLDIYYKKKENTKKPVVIYIYGGTWYLGEKSLYSKLGDFLNNNGYVGVIPNYVQFPYGTLDEMIEDICNAIIWVYNNIGKYNGDNQNMILLGHSSGAHLSALTLIKSALRLKGYGSYSITKSLPLFQRVVLLNGPYDFDVFSEMSKSTGITSENSSFESFASAILGSKLSCPTDILKNYSNKSIQYLGANRFNIIHSTKDTVVPISSASGLLDQIQRTSNIPAYVYVVEGFPHCGITEGVMNGNEYAQYVLRTVLAAA